MKHWIEFIENRSHYDKRLGKVAVSLHIDYIDREVAFKNAKSNLERFEYEIKNKLSSDFNNEVDFNNAIENAKAKADNWNTTPIKSHKPTHQKK